MQKVKLGYLMVKRIVNVIINDLSKSVSYSQEQREHVEYTLTVITYELIKIILIVLILYMLGLLKEGLAVLLTIITTKPFIGGYHEDSQIKCFFATITIVCSMIILGRNIELNMISIIILNIFSIFCIYHRAPVINERMQLTKEKLIRRNRKIGLVNVSLLAMISIISYKGTVYGELICLTNVVQTMLMFNKYKKRE